MVIKRIKRKIEKTKESFKKGGETIRDSEKEIKHIKRGRDKKKNEGN